MLSSIKITYKGLCGRCLSDIIEWRYIMSCWYFQQEPVVRPEWDWSTGACAGTERCLSTGVCYVLNVTDLLESVLSLNVAYGIHWSLCWNWTWLCLHEPVLVLDLIVYTNLCCSLTWLSTRAPVLVLNLIVSTWACAGTGFNCLHEPVLVLDLIVCMSLCWYWI
jgi:hypothetical protein